MEEGTQVNVESNEIGLVVGQPVSFRFFRSNQRQSDQPGDLVANWEDQLEESDPLNTTLSAEGWTTATLRSSLKRTLPNWGCLNFGAAP